MRRLVAALATLVLVPLGAAPAHAATNTVTVDGFDYPSGLISVDRPCGATPYDGNVLHKYRAGGAIGSHATGLGFTSTIGEAGAEVAVATPSALTEISFETFHALGPSGSAPGSFYASIDPSGGGFQTYYFTNVNLNVGFANWNVWHLEDNLLDWYYWNGASVSGPVELDTSIAQFASDYGNGSGARFGVMFGCDGREYYMDNLRVGVGSNTKVYDFEAVPTLTYLSSFKNHHAQELTVDLRKLELLVGQSHWLAGDGLSLGDGVTGDGWFTGPARLYAKRYDKSKFSLVQSKNFTTTAHAWFLAKELTKNTVYRIDGPGTGTFEPSRSLTLSVGVKRRVKLHIADTTIFRGQSLRVSGHVRPRNPGVRVSVQRKASGGWQTIAKGLTRGGGEYSFAPRLKIAGKPKIRVRAADGKGNLGNKSPYIEVTVKVPPPKPPPPTPPDDDDVETPPPPEPHDPGGPKPGRVMLRDLYGQFWGLDATAAPAPRVGTSTDAVSQRPLR